MFGTFHTFCDVPDMQNWVPDTQCTVPNKHCEVPDMQNWVPDTQCTVPDKLCEIPDMQFRVPDMLYFLLQKMRIMGCKH